MRIRLGSLWIIGFVIAVLGSWVNVAHAGDVKLSWTSPLTCADNSPLVNCPTTGYEVNSAPSETGALTAVETLAASALSKTYNGLVPGKYCYAVKTVSNTQKSDPTPIACATVPSLPPKAPQGYSVTVVVTVTPGP